MDMSYEGKKLSLDKDCIFVQLDKPGDSEPRSVVLNHKTGQHWTPQNDAARMVLDLLTRNFEHGKKKGITFDDIRLHLVRRYAVDVKKATEDLDAFLVELARFGLLDDKDKETDPVDDAFYQHKPGEARGHIVAGGTLICCGSSVNWTRP